MKLTLVCMLVIISSMFMLLSGCQKVENPVTGNNEYRLDPNMVPKVEGGIDKGLTAGSIIASLVYPAALPTITLLAGIFGAWLKIRPRFNEYRDTNGLLYAIASSSVAGIDELKNSNPEAAAKLLETLEGLLNKLVSAADRRKVENVIRGLRGLPPIT